MTDTDLNDRIFYFKLTVSRQTFKENIYIYIKKTKKQKHKRDPSSFTDTSQRRVQWEMKTLLTLIISSPLTRSSTSLDPKWHLTSLADVPWGTLTSMKTSSIVWYQEPQGVLQGTTPLLSSKCADMLRLCHQLTGRLTSANSLSLSVWGERRSCANSLLRG